jgi:hypothetical protein
MTAIQNMLEMTNENLRNCADTVVDDVCGVALCAEHSNEFATCGGTNTRLHHWGCIDDCDECQAVRAQDHAEGNN